MDETQRSTLTWPLLVLLLAVLSLALQPSFAADSDLEREQLAVLARQLDLIDRLAEQTARSSSNERADGSPSPALSRYHFDYGRLRADLQRVRAGVQDYLTPQRAQPRDPQQLAGDYSRTNAAGGKEATAP